MRILEGLMTEGALMLVGAGKPLYTYARDSAGAAAT